MIDVTNKESPDENKYAKQLIRKRKTVTSKKVSGFRISGFLKGEGN